MALAGCSGVEGSVDTVASTASTAPTAPTSSTAADPEVDQRSPDGANGIKVAADGTLWIASLASDEVLQVDAETGRILRRVSVPEGSGPDDVALDHDGTVFWTGFLSGDVGRIDLGVGTGDEEVTVITNVGAGANPIALREDGMLLVGRAGAATGLYVVDPAGATEASELSDAGNLNSFDVADGVLFAPSLTETAVITVDPVTGERVDAVAHLDGAPIALRWHDSALFVLELTDAARVVRVSLPDGEVEPFGDPGLAVADNLAVADDGTVYVTGLTRPTVSVLSPSGELLRTMQIGA